MRRVLILLVFLVGCTFGSANFSGWGDTLAIRDTLADGTVLYSAATRLSEYEDIRLITLVNDTAIANLGADSINFYYGYQTGCPVLDSAGALDTIWDDRITIDTMSVDSFGVANVGKCESDGSMTRNWGGVDSTSVTDYAVQSRWFLPEWDVYIRYWAVSGDGKQVEDRPLQLFFVPVRRIYSNTRRN